MQRGRHAGCVVTDHTDIAWQRTSRRTDAPPRTTDDNDADIVRALFHHSDARQTGKGAIPAHKPGATPPVAINKSGLPGRRHNTRPLAHFNRPPAYPSSFRPVGADAFARLPPSPHRADRDAPPPTGPPRESIHEGRECPSPNTSPGTSPPAGGAPSGTLPRPPGQRPGDTDYT